MSAPDAETIRELAKARRHGPEAVAVLVGGDPGRQAIVDWLADTLAQAPPATPEQRAGIRAVFRGVQR